MGFSVQTKLLLGTMKSYPLVGKEPELVHEVENMPQMGTPPFGCGTSTLNKQ